MEASTRKPMITTLIPAYKPTFIDELLISLVTQSFKQFKVIISDDSPDQVVTAVIKSKQLAHITQQLNLEIVTGPQSGGFSNIYHLVRTHANDSEFFHLLFDDDVIYPTFYESHLREHMAKRSLVSVSPRWTANETGQPIAQSMDYVTSQALSQSFSAHNIAKHMVAIGTNKLGEFSHFLYRKEAANILLNPTIDGISYFGLDDIGSIVHATIEQEGIWIPQALGFFRTHKHQNTQNTQNDTIKCAHFAWIALAISCLERGWITEPQAWQCIRKMQGKIQMRFSQDALGIKMLEVIANHLNHFHEFKQAFLGIWDEYLAELRINAILNGDTTIKLY